MPGNPTVPALGAFRGDFAALAAMIQRSWADNANVPLLYSEEFLRSQFDYPGSSFELAPSVYGELGMLGFIAGFPRRIRWDGRPARILLNSLLTASTVVKGAGLALKVYGELIARCRAAGYDGTIGYCVDGDDMNRIMPGLSKLFKLNTQRVCSVEFVTRFLRPVPPEAAPEVAEADIDLFLDLAAEVPGELPLVRVWTRAEAEWQCRGRLGAITVSARVDGRRGMLTGYLAEAASTPPTPIVLLEDLFWGDLEAAERSDLLARFLRIAAAQGAKTASCPVLGYASTDTLTAAGFRPSKRVLHMYLTLWNGLEPRPVPELYVDVF
jgi:hypothetical protein